MMTCFAFLSRANPCAFIAVPDPAGRGPARQHVRGMYTRSGPGGNFRPVPPEPPASREHGRPARAPARPCNGNPEQSRLEAPLPMKKGASGFHVGKVGGKEVRQGSAVIPSKAHSVIPAKAGIHFRRFLTAECRQDARAPRDASAGNDPGKR